MKFHFIAATILFLAAPASIARPVETLSHFLERGGYSQIALKKLPTGHETLAVVLNGTPSTFVLDSGSGATVVHAVVGPRFGLDAANRIGDDTGAGAGGDVGVAIYRINGITLSGYKVPLGRIHTIDLTAVVNGLSKEAGVQIDGVIGQDILTQYGGIIDVANDRLYLRLPR